MDYCLREMPAEQEDVTHTWKQCMDRWNRVYKGWKAIYDYGRKTHHATLPIGQWMRGLVARRSSHLTSKTASLKLLRCDELKGSTDDANQSTDGVEPQGPTLKEQTSGHKRRKKLGHVGEALRDFEESTVNLADQIHDVEVST